MALLDVELVELVLVPPVLETPEVLVLVLPVLDTPLGKLGAVTCPQKGRQ